MEKQITKEQLQTLSGEVLKLKNLRNQVEDSSVRSIIISLDNDYPDISIETLETIIKEYKKREEVLSREIIPTILNECFLSKIKLVTGEEIEIKEQLKVKIADKNYSQAFRNMVDQYMKDNPEAKKEGAENYINELFKTKLTVNNDFITEKTYQVLIDNEIPYDTKKDIHPQTLKKYCQDLVEQGKQIPEGINSFQYQETKIKK